MTESSSLAVRGRRSRSREEAERLVREFEQSGMTRTAFCEAQGIALQTLAYYRQKYRRPGRPGAAHLLPVELVGSLPARDSHLRLELANGRRIAVEQGFDAILLKRLIAVLEG
jgi:transposase-like protein